MDVSFRVNGDVDVDDVGLLAVAGCVDVSADCDGGVCDCAPSVFVFSVSVFMSEPKSRDVWFVLAADDFETDVSFFSSVSFLSAVVAASFVLGL